MAEFDRFVDTQLHQAIRSNNLPRVQRLLSEGADPNEENFDGSVPLATCAAASADLTIAQCLLDAGAHPDGVAGWSSPLVSAVIENQCELVKLLVKAGADPNQPDDDEDTALMWAIIKENSDLAGYFLSIGADPRLKNRYGRTARDFAQEKGNAQIIVAIDKELARQR